MIHYTKFVFWTVGMLDVDSELRRKHLVRPYNQF